MDWFVLLGGLNDVEVEGSVRYEGRAGGGGTEEPVGEELLFQSVCVSWDMNRLDDAFQLCC